MDDGIQAVRQSNNAILETIFAEFDDIVDDLDDVYNELCKHYPPVREVSDEEIEKEDHEGDFDVDTDLTYEEKERATQNALEFLEDNDA